MPAYHKFQLGDLQLISFSDNQQSVDVRQEMQQVPEAELLAAMQSKGYEDFETKIGFNILYAKTEMHQILIDCGTGMNNLVKSIQLAGLDPLTIDYLIITHSDFDHIGGIDDFPNAKIIFPQQAFDLWTTEATRKVMIEKFQEVFLKFLDPKFVAKGVEYREHYGAVKLPALENRMLHVEPEEEFLPGFKLVFIPGHRPDHYAVEITSANKTLVHIADAYRHKIQVEHPEWYTRFDSYPEQMKESVLKINQRIKSKDALIFGSHFTFPGLGRFVGEELVFVEV